MSDNKSKLPDLKELTSMTGKFLKGIKNTVDEIIEDYKQKRAEPTASKKPTKEETHEAKPDEIKVKNALKKRKLLVKSKTEGWA